MGLHFKEHIGINGVSLPPTLLLSSSVQLSAPPCTVPHLQQNPIKKQEINTNTHKKNNTTYLKHTVKINRVQSTGYIAIFKHIFYVKDWIAPASSSCLIHWIPTQPGLCWGPPSVVSDPLICSCHQASAEADWQICLIVFCLTTTASWTLKLILPGFHFLHFGYSSLFNLPCFGDLFCLFVWNIWELFFRGVSCIWALTSLIPNS